uniref:Uncharacterized protein n=1 Tax=Macrostomum lignano TaxID=282301 RepID=A0A1I8GU36_9PLAT
MARSPSPRGHQLNHHRDGATQEMLRQVTRLGSPLTHQPTARSRRTRRRCCRSSAPARPRCLACRQASLSCWRWWRPSAAR